MTRDSETVASAMNDPVSDADVFTTARLIARHWVFDDIPAAHEISRHAAVTRFLGVEPHPDADATRSALRRRIDGDVDRPGPGPWAVVERDTGAVVGCVHLAPLLDSGEIEVGYEFAPDHWGHGYATEIARGALDHPWDTVGLRRVIGIVYPDDVASQPVLDKVGMVRDGVFTIGPDAFSRYVATPSGSSLKNGAPTDPKVRAGPGDGPIRGSHR